MALIRRDPQTIWPEVFDRGWFDLPFRPFEAWHKLVDEVNVEEFLEDGEVVVRAELPGVDPDRDVDISIVGGNLQIRAERRQEEKTERRNYRRTEIRYGSFTRTLPLPPGTDENQIKASYKDGMLEVRAPVSEGPTKSPKIPISRT